MPRDARARAGVVVPLRSFTDAKARLAPVLGPDERAALARRMADRVIDAAHPLDVVVVTSAPEVRAWAAARSLEVVDDPGTLDSAADAGRELLRQRDYTRAVIAHGDLPRARSLLPLADDPAAGEVALVPCHRGDGTNVLSVPTETDFVFSYGPGSFRRHLAEAERLGLAVRVVRAPDLMIDVDTPEDLAHIDVPCP
jgi:2-phospho-L-lactate guanylyltransferase